VIQVHVSHETHKKNFLNGFKVVEPVITLTHIRPDGISDQQILVAKAKWEARSQIVYTESVPQYGAAVFVRVDGPVWYQRTKLSKWEVLES